MTKTIWVLTIASVFVFAMMMIGLSFPNIPAYAAETCPPNYHLMDWPQGEEPDHNENGKVCARNVLQIVCKDPKAKANCNGLIDDR